LKIPARRKSQKARQNNTTTKRKMTKGKTMIYKTPHRKLKIEQSKPY
jgi:hypothetical protein